IRDFHVTGVQTCALPIFKEINNKHRKAWLKNVLYNSVFFPVADLVSSITLGIVIWVGAKDILMEGGTTMGDLMTYTMLIGMLFNPLRQIADKFNEMQMGMIAANRIFDILESDLSQKSGSIEELDRKSTRLNSSHVKISYA